MFLIVFLILGMAEMIDYIAAYAIVVTCLAAAMLAFFCGALAYYGIKRFFGVDDEA